MSVSKPHSEFELVRRSLRWSGSVHNKDGLAALARIEEQYAAADQERDDLARLLDEAIDREKGLEEQLEAYRSALDEIAWTPSGRQKAATLEGYIEADGVMRTIARNALDSASNPASSLHATCPAEEWYCLCWNYLRHRVLRPATMERCPTCGLTAPWIAVASPASERQYVEDMNGVLHPVAPSSEQNQESKSD